MVHSMSGDVYMSRSVAEFALKNPSLPWFLRIRVPRFALRPSSSHPPPDEVKFLDEIDFGSVLVAALWTWENRKSFTECQKSIKGTILIGVV